MTADPWLDADAQARRLAPTLHVSWEQVREAVYLRTVATGEPPSDDEVRVFVRRRLGEMTRDELLSGRYSRANPVRAVEEYRAPDGAVWRVDQRPREGSHRQTWMARDPRSDDVLCQARTRASVRRQVETAHPGGTWTYTLSQRDRADVLRLWGDE